MARGKRLEDAYKEIDVKKKYTLVEAIALTKKLCPTKKFDASVEVAIRLGVDPKQSDQQVRSTVVMPHGTGKKVRVLVFAAGDKEKDAQEAGADYVGSTEFLDKVKAGWTDFDACVATPDMMKALAPLGKVLGPRGLMPNPKLGTVTFDVGKAVRELKAGKIEFRVEKAGIVHAPIGKASFGEAQLLDNFLAFYEAVNKAKPSTTKGNYMKACSVSSTMGPGIRVDLGTVRNIKA